ncbi:MAG: cardiolipin synthase [Phycisphaerales bacterium]|nr:cardiolipin synthase [Phycisphaerales bacterium]
MERVLSTLWDILVAFWPHLLTGMTLLIGLTASGHVILHKRDVRSAIAWVGLIWLAPISGAILYAWLGINRIHRRARTLRQRHPLPIGFADARACPYQTSGNRPPFDNHLCSLARLIEQISGRTLFPGNQLTVLDSDTPCYPIMLEAIEQATTSVSLATYIFDNDRAGRAFLEALTRAVKRGVEVRVLIDGVGIRYSWPSIARPLQQAGIPFARFLPRLMPGVYPYANLRNHRKIMVVDGHLGFTGGMNIREGHWRDLNPAYPIEDLHFRVEGPVVAHMQDVFAEDWFFSTHETLDGDPWFPSLNPVGNVYSRGISDGPDIDFDKLRLTLLGALACARSSVRIVTPYFLPDSALITAMSVAAMRGVEVDVVLPQENNLRLVQWASTALLWQILEHGCRVWLSPPPFDHTKLMVVDGTWTLLGSTNWDPRSLRLNFEFNLECYDRELADRLEKLIATKIRMASRLTQKNVDGRSLPRKLRDGVARLLSPYL